jgi:hypothetical protein
MKRLLFFTVMAIAMNSCYYDNGDDLYPVDPNDCQTDSLTYDNQIGVLINLTCSTRGCHYTGVQPPALTNYQEVIANLDRIEVRALQERTMPPSGPLSQCEHTQLTQWIANGAPQN